MLEPSWKKILEKVDSERVSRYTRPSRHAATSSRNESGVRRSGSTAAADFFTGDIAAVKLYGTALTKAQMRDLGEHWAKKYATQLLVGYAFDEGKLRERGLGATNVMVVAGARLSLPLSDDAPFTLRAGSTVAGAGEFYGSYRLLSGATFDTTSAMPEFFDELQLAGGTVKIDRSAANPVKVRRLKASGENVVCLDGNGDPAVRKTILEFDEADIADGATWVVRGEDTSRSRIVVDKNGGKLVLRTQTGSILIVE